MDLGLNWVFGFEFEAKITLICLSNDINNERWIPKEYVNMYIKDLWNSKVDVTLYG